jgi:hypothetical protein
MENQIFAIESTFWKAIAIKEGELWLSQDKVKNFEKFEKGIQKSGLLKSAYAYPLTSVSEISFNEATESIKLRYQDEKGKQKKLNIKFSDKDVSNQFGEFLGKKLEMKRNQKQEKQLKPLLLNAIYLIISIVATVLFATLDDTSELTDSGSGRQRRKGAFVKMIVDTIGQTGIILIGSLISIYLIYQLYTRFKNPAIEVVYQK